MKVVMYSNVCVRVYEIQSERCKNGKKKININK